MYDPYGTVIYQGPSNLNINITNNGAGSTNTVNYTGPIAGNYDGIYKFQTQELDNPSQLYFLRARYYDPSIGRFITRDPLSGKLIAPMSQNAYIYTEDNPINFIDPSGLIRNDGDGAPDLLRPIADFLTGGNSQAFNDPCSTTFQKAMVIAAMVPGGEEARGEITITEDALTHVLERHVVGGVRAVGKSTFSKPEEIQTLIKQSEGIEPVLQQRTGNYQRTVDAGRNIGIDRATGQPTSTYTVITDPLGVLKTAFPGVPGR